jgi:hypothetical protein
VLETLRPLQPLSEIMSYEPQGSVGGDCGDVGQPAIAFAKFYYMSRYFNHKQILTASFATS